MKIGPRRQDVIRIPRAQKELQVLPAWPQRRAKSPLREAEDYFRRFRDPKQKVSLPQLRFMSPPAVHHAEHHADQASTPAFRETLP